MGLLIYTGESVMKMEAEIQTSGEAEFTDDIPPTTNQLYGAVVLTEKANCKLDSIDASAAMVRT